jgi:hypothetical protein
MPIIPIPNDGLLRSRQVYLAHLQPGVPPACCYLQCTGIVFKFRFAATDLSAPLYRWREWTPGLHRVEHALGTAGSRTFANRCKFRVGITVTSPDIQRQARWCWSSGFEVPSLCACAVRRSAFDQHIHAKKRRTKNAQRHRQL